MARPPFHRAGPALVMGVCNVTPDSFSGDGHGSDHLAAIAHGKELFASGCSIVDVGGVSTRPGAASVDEDAELSRVLDVVQALSQIGRVSIDTKSVEVARRAVAAGATMLNDVSGNLGELAGELGIGYIGMHSRGTPETMQSLTDYDDVVAEVTASILTSCRRAAASGAMD
ncbi:MAG: dihydropteroate synthase, partial [Actinomycetota bacterium]